MNYIHHTKLLVNATESSLLCTIKVKRGTFCATLGVVTDLLSGQSCSGAVQLLMTRLGVACTELWDQVMFSHQEGTNCWTSVTQLWVKWLCAAHEQKTVVWGLLDLQAVSTVSSYLCTWIACVCFLLRFVDVLISAFNDWNSFGCDQACVVLYKHQHNQLDPEFTFSQQKHLVQLILPSRGCFWRMSCHLQEPKSSTLWFYSRSQNMYHYIIGYSWKTGDTDTNYCKQEVRPTFKTLIGCKCIKWFLTPQHTAENYCTYPQERRTAYVLYKLHAICLNPIAVSLHCDIFSNARCMPFHTYTHCCICLVQYTVLFWYVDDLWRSLCSHCINLIILILLLRVVVSLENQYQSWTLQVGCQMWFRYQACASCLSGLTPGLQVTLLY